MNGLDKKIKEICLKSETFEKDWENICYSYSYVLIEQSIYKNYRVDLISHLKPFEKVMYLFINKDLNMSIGKVATQSARVMSLLAMSRDNTENDLFTDSFVELKMTDQFKGNKIITVGIKEKEFEKFENMVFDTPYNVTFHKTYDSGLTEVEANSLTAMIMTPVYRKDLPKAFKRLQLLK